MKIRSRALGCLVRLNTPAKLWQIKVNCTLEINHLSYWTQMSSPFRLWQKSSAYKLPCKPNRAKHCESECGKSWVCHQECQHIFLKRRMWPLGESTVNRAGLRVIIPACSTPQGKKLISLFIKPSYSIEDILLLLQFRLIQTYLFKISKSYSTKFGNSSAIFNITQKQLLHCQENSAGLSKMFSI